MGFCGVIMRILKTGGNGGLCPFIWHKPATYVLTKSWVATEEGPEGNFVAFCPDDHPVGHPRVEITGALHKKG